MRWNANANPAIAVWTRFPLLLHTPRWTLGSHHSSHMHSCCCVCVYASVCVCSNSVIMKKDICNGFVIQTVTHTYTKASKLMQSPPPNHFICLCCSPDVWLSVGSCGWPGGVRLLLRHVRVCLGAGSPVLHLSGMVVSICRRWGQVRRYRPVCVVAWGV